MKSIFLIFKTVVVLWAIGLVTFFSIQFYKYGDLQEYISKKNSYKCSIDSTFAWRLNDVPKNHFEASKLNGLNKTLTFKKEIFPLLFKGKLIKIVPCELYHVDTTMEYSYPYGQKKVSIFLNEFALLFKKSLTQTDLEDTRFIVTSVLRTHSSIKRLKKKNKNAISHSTHLHGNTFDIAYDEFVSNKALSTGEIHYLREKLAKVLFKMRSENKCWVKYEIFQKCFHVVCRN